MHQGAAKNKAALIPVVCSESTVPHANYVLCTQMMLKFFSGENKMNYFNETERQIALKY